MNLKGLFGQAMTYVNKNSPMFLTGLGVVGVVTTGVMAYKAGPKAHQIMLDYRKDKELIDPDDKETKRIVTKEAAVKLAPVILPPIAMGILTCVCIISSHKISMKRVAVLSAAYNLADNKLKDYQKKVFETVGEMKNNQIKESIAKEHLDNTNTHVPAIITGYGDMPCLDGYTGTKFLGSQDKINKVILKLSKEIAELKKREDEPFIELWELYYELGIEEQPPFSRDFGWYYDDLQDDGTLPIYTTAILKDGIAYVVMEYELSASHDYIYRNMDR